jgi:hypothetical protein
MAFTGFIEAIKANLVIISECVAAMGVILAAVNRVWAYLKRSRLLVPNAFPLPEIPGELSIFEVSVPDLSTMLVGRQHQVDKLTEAIQNNRMTFLYGESGSGKSTLLKLGVARELVRSGSWVPIYVDVWGQNWISGPQKSLAGATDFSLRSLSLSKDQPVVAKTIIARLRAFRESTGRTPVLLLDQIDDYQNTHRAHFYSAETGVLLNPQEICEANPFWRNLRDLLLEPGDKIHIVLATRDDAQSGLHCFQFDEPRVFPLFRLDAADAKTLIHVLAPASVVDKPENGFNDLMDKIVAELGHDHGGKVLPMQLRVALAGVGREEGPLTPSLLDHLGGVAGLGAKYLESVISNLPPLGPS